MEPVDQRATRLARTQRGCATRRQLRDDASVSAATITRRLKDGRWSEPLPTVIDLGTHEASWRKEVQLQLLAAGAPAWASHASAAHLHRFLDVPRPERPDILVPRGRATEVADLRFHTTVAIADDEVTVVDGIPCTVRARTLLDIAAYCTVHEIERFAADVARRDRAAIRQVGELLDRYRHAPARRRVIEAISRLPADAALLGSPLEVLTIAELRRLGAPDPVLQYRVRDRGGAVTKRVDAAWPDAMTLVEVDGRAYHDQSAARLADEAVRATMRSLGWTVEVLRRADLEGDRLGELAARLRRLLG